MMKATLFALFVALLMVGFGENSERLVVDISESKKSSLVTPPVKPLEVAKIDFDDPVLLEKIIAEAIDVQTLENRDKTDHILSAPMKQIPYTGWGKFMLEDKKVRKLSQYKDGKQHGIAISFDQSGNKIRQLRIVPLMVRDGPFVEWHQNGRKKREGNYEEGSFHGFQTKWYENGQKQFQENWNEGQIWDAVAWKPNGEKCSRTNLKNGNGVLFFYFENGNKKTEEKRKNGKLDGTWRSWHENGQRSLERSIENGKLMSFTHWKASGEEFSAVDYGEKIYKVRCASCHVLNGLGISSVFPPLAGSKWVTSDPGIVCKVIMNGLKGEIQVKGQTYGATPAQQMVAVPINNRDLAHVVTYIRQAWGNSPTDGNFEVTEKQVSRYRKESESKVGQWTAKELGTLYPQLLTEKKQ
jgi:antitoxin component YwqK of YwqJK toxin-antitoxin module